MCINGGVGCGVGGIGGDNGVGGEGSGGGGGEGGSVSDEIVARGPQGICICMQYFPLEGLNSPLGGIGGGSGRGSGGGGGGGEGGEGGDDSDEIVATGPQGI